MEAIAVRLGTDLRVFSAIGNKQLTTTEIAAATGATPELMGTAI
jgi:hypothetical protein